MKSYSVVIVGGGPAGCAVAIALLQLGIKDVLILESEDYTKFAIGESIKSAFASVGNTRLILKRTTLTLLWNVFLLGRRQKRFQ